MRGNDKQLKSETPWRKFQLKLQKVFGNKFVELTIGGLIVISVGMTLLEYSYAADSIEFYWLDKFNYIITCIFVVELSLRYISMENKRNFFRYYWIDILAVLPVLRTFRMLRAFRFFRFLRLLRLLGLFSRYASYFPYIARRGALEYIIVSGLIILTVIFGSTAILTFERNTEKGNIDQVQSVEATGEEDETIDTMDEAIWFSIYSLFAGEPTPQLPKTLAGRLVAVFIMFMGMTVFAMFTGTISAFMVERLRMEGKMVEWDRFSEHVIICGYNRRVEIIVKEYITGGHMGDDPMVIISEKEEEPNFSDPAIEARIRYLKGDFTKVSVLKEAGILRAKTCMILSDHGPGRTEQDVDARTILCALTVEKLSPEVYTVAELYNGEYASHLEMGNVNDYVLSSDQSAFMMAHASMNQGLMSVFSELLTNTRGSQFYRIMVPEEMWGKSSLDLFTDLKQNQDAVLVAVQRNGDCNVNPTNHVFVEGDSIIVIASEEPTL